MRELTLDEIEAVSGAGFWGDFWGAIGNLSHSVADFLGFDGRFGYQGGGGGGLSFGNFFGGFGDLLGFDGQFGYSIGPVDGPDAFFAPPLLDVYFEPLPNLLDATIPPVHLYPFEVSLQDMRALAAQIGTQIGNQSNEFASIIYYDGQGNLHASQLFTQNSPTSVSWDPTALPPGSTIAAIIHNHPGNALEYPSSSFTDNSGNGGDWASVYRLIGTDYSPWGVNVSPFVVQYIAGSGGTYEYFLDGEPGDSIEARQFGERVG